MERKKVGKSIASKFIESANTQIVNFIVGIILARLLSPEDYGVYSILLIFINIGQTLVQGGLGSAIIQKKHADEEDYSTVFVVSLLVAVVAYSLLFMAAPIIAQIYEISSLVGPLRVIALVLFPGVLSSVVNARLVKRLEFDVLAKYSSVCALFTGIVGIALAVAGVGVWALVAQQILSFLLFPIVYCIRKHWFPGWQFRWSNCQALFGFGIRILLTDVVNSVYLNIQGLIIGIKYSADSLAYFNKGQIFPRTLLTTIDSTVSTVLFPVYADLQDEHDSMKKMLLSSLNRVTFVVYPMLLGMYAVSDLMIDVVLTEKWITCVKFVEIYCIAYLFWPLDSIAQQLIKACGAGKIYLNMSLLKKCISSSILLVSVYLSRSVEIFALSAIMIYISDVTIDMMAAGKLITISLLDIVRSIGSNLLCSCGILAIRLIPRVFTSNWLEFILRISLGVFVYVALSNAFNRKALRETLDSALRCFDKIRK